MLPYKKFLKLNELQVDLSLPISDETQLEIIETAKYEGGKFLKEFSKHRVALYSEVILPIADYHIVNDNKLSQLKGDPLESNTKIGKYYGEFISDYLSNRYKFELDGSIILNSMRISLAKKFTNVDAINSLIRRNQWIIIPLGAFNYITLHENMTYESIIKSFAIEVKDIYGFDNDVDVNSDRFINIVKSDSSFKERLANYLDTINFRNGPGNNGEIIGSSLSGRYLLIDIGYYMRNWLHSKIMRPGVISKAFY